MSIRRFVLTLPALVLVLLLLAGVFPGGAAFAEGGGDPLALRFVCDETVASVMVYDPAGLPLPVGADGIHHLTPGTYFYSATAEGYENTGLQAFTIPADAAGDQELRISLTPVPGSVPPDASVPGQTPVNVPDPNAPEENPEDDGKLRIRPVDGSLTLTIERETRAESAVPPELQRLVEGKQKPLQTADGKPVEKKLWLKTPDAEELYLDRLAVEKEIGYYTTDWTVLNLTDEEGSRKNLVPASGWYDVTVSGPATEPYRAYEPVFALVTLHWDEDGDIVDRDVQILETTHTPTKSSWSFSTDTLSTLVIAVPTDRPVESEEAAAKKDRPAFAASSTVDGVTVTVSAPAGVFPADAALWVQRVPLTEEIDAAVEAERDEQKTVAVSYTFDIRVVNPETMEEYQPEEGQSVSVSFALAEVADENLETRVYHVTEEESTGALTAEALDVSESGLTATAETDGFSYYQVEFTYEKLEYVLPGDTSVPLAEILAELGLSGDVTEVSCSNTNLFSCDWTENRWVVTAHRAFSSTEWMKVTLNGVVYEITVTDEGSEGFIFEDGGTLIGYTGNGGVVVIPDNYNGDPVTGIIGAFDHNNDITNVVIPASVNYITSGSFVGCENLLSVTFVGESALTRIEDDTFSDCSKLNSINIPLGVTSIGRAAFYRCISLTSINIPSGVTSIGPEAFEWTGLTGIEIPASVTSIGNRAFEGCQNLTSINIPSGVTSIGEKAFSGCSKLNSINIPSTVTSIGNNAFFYCPMQYICYGGTRNTWNTMSSSSGVPSGCKIVTARANQDEGGTVAFGTGSTSVTVTASPNSGYAFVNWTENVNGSVTTVSTDASYSFTPDTDRDLVANFVQIVASGYCGGEGDGTNLTWVLDNNGTLTISGTGAMYDYYDYSNSVTPPWYSQISVLTNVVIGADVTSIGNGAFYSCTGLESVTFIGQSALKSIGYGAFQACFNLQSIEIPSTVTSIGAHAFNGCRKLGGIKIPAGVTSIWDGAFAGCDALTSVTFATESKLESIGDYAFDNCINLRGIEIPSTVTSIGDYAFNSCVNLQSIEIPSTVTSIGEYAFKGCRNLGSIEIPASVMSIGDAAFVGCDNLRNVTFIGVSQLASIGKDTFNGCYNLQSIEIPASVTSIGDYAFHGCDFLKSVTFKEGSQLTSIGNDAFHYCYNLQSIEIPSGVTSIGSDAFTDDAKLSDIWYHGTESQWSNVPKGANWDGANSNLTVHCELSISASADPSAGGTVTISSVPGAPAVSGPGKAWSNTDVTMTATANSNYAFDEWTWTEGGVTKSSTENPYTFTATTDRTLIAHFVLPVATPTIDKQPTALSWTYGETTKEKKLSVTASVSDDGTLSYQWYLNTADSTTGGTEVTGATSKEYTVPGGTETDAGTYYYYCVVTNTKNGATATATSNTATVTVDKAQLTITAQDQNYIYNGQTQGEGDTIYKDQAVIAEKITVGEGQLKGTDTVTSITIDGQGKEPDTYDLTASAAAIGPNGNKTANYNISYEKGTLTIVPPAVAEIKATKVLEGRNWKDGDSFTFELAAVNGAPMPAATSATAKKDAHMANFGEATYYSVGTFEYTITESKGSLDGVTYDTAPHTVLVTVAQSDPKQAPTAEVKYDRADSLTVTNTFTPATATLEVAKSFNDWRAGDSFTFTLAAVTEGAPMPANNTTATATATEADPTATFGEITYDKAGTYKYTITETDGGKPGVTYDTTAHNVVVTVTKADDATNKLTAEVKYDEAASLTVTNSRQFFVIDTSMTGGTVTATPASAAVGDTVTLTVTPDKGSELTSLTVTKATGTAVDLDQKDPNQYSFEMPATDVEVTATFKEILYAVVEGADSSWLKGSNGDLSIRVKRDPKDETCFQHFRNGGTVAIDGTVLSEDTSALIQKDYKAEEGSTVITLHKKMLNRLSAGKHTVTITFDDGSVSTGLTILVPAGGYSPGTGDSARVGFWAALMVLAGLGFAGADYARRKLRRPRYVGKHM